MEEKRLEYRALVGKPKGKRPPGRLRRIGVDNILLDPQEVEWGAWFGFIWLRIGTGGQHL
jgi:hypothetical protein